MSGTKPVARVEYSAWNIAFSTEKTVTKQEAFLVDILSAVSQFLSLGGEQVHMVFELWHMIRTM